MNKLLFQINNAFEDYIETHRLKIKSLNNFYNTDIYKTLSKEELKESFNWIYISCEQWDKCNFLKRKYWKRNCPEDWYILK